MLTILIHCLWWFNHSLVMESWFQFSESKENVMWFHGLRRSGHSLLWAVWLLLCPRCVQEVCIRHWCIEFHDICIRHIIFFGCGLLWTLIRLDLFVATQTNNIVLLWVLVFDSVKLKWTRFGKTQIRYLRAYISDFMFAILNQCFFPWRADFALGDSTRTSTFDVGNSKTASWHYQIHWIHWQSLNKVTVCLGFNGFVGAFLYITICLVEFLDPFASNKFIGELHMDSLDPTTNYGHVTCLIMSIYFVIWIALLPRMEIRFVFFDHDALTRKM